MLSNSMFSFMRFGAKEPSLRALNDFMLRNIFPMTRYLRDISVSRWLSTMMLRIGKLMQHPGQRGEVIDDDATEEAEYIPATLNQHDRKMLHQFLYDSADRIGKELVSLRRMQP
jgi:hypothetical protein